MISEDFSDSKICWKLLQGSSQWEAQYALSEEGSPMYLDDDNGNLGPSNDDMLDEEGPVVCNGLDHADSQGLNKTNLRLRYGNQTVRLEIDCSSHAYPPTF